MIQFKINFGGFYWSHYSEAMDHTIEREINEGYMVDDSKVNYQKIHEAMAEDIHDKTENYINDLIHYFSINLKYVELVSPKYYNYSTDVIISEISEEDYKTIFEYYNGSVDFVEYVNEHSKSYDGFISHYVGIDEVRKEPSIFMEYLFNYLIKLDGDQYLYATLDNLTETIYNNLS